MGIVVGAMALFVVLSVFSGLRDFSLSFSNDFDADLKATPAKGKSFYITREQQDQLAKTDGVAAYTKIIEERVLFRFSGKEKVAWLKGVDSLFPKVNDVRQILYNGNWLKPNTSQVVVGYGIADDISMGLFDFNNTLETYVPKAGKGNIDSPEEAFNKANLIPIGIYAINEDLDKKYVFTDLGLAQDLLEYQPNQISGIEIDLKPGADENLAAKKIGRIFKNSLEIKTRAQQNDSLYRMLNTENLAVYLIFTLVIIIALFNLIGALIMMILDKKSNLKTLLSLGTEIKDLRKIFLLQGSLLTIIGGVFGLLLGMAIVVLQQKFKLVMITESLAYPVVFSLVNVAIVLGTIICLGIVASWIAASRVSKKLLD